MKTMQILLIIILMLSLIINAVLYTINTKGIKTANKEIESYKYANEILKDVDNLRAQQIEKLVEQIEILEKINKNNDEIINFYKSNQQ